MNFLLFFENLSWLEWIIFSLISNTFLYLFSIGFYLFVDKTCSKNKIQMIDHPFLKSDLYVSFLTLSLNIVVMLIGVYLWKSEWITLNESKTILTVLIEIVTIILVMDLMMYIFHYMVHHPFIYKILHRKHHEHTSTNFLSLFVLHPFETLGFGLMMISVFMLHDFSIFSITIYLFINLIWGTIGHLNREFFPKWTEKLFLGTTKFHNQHHLNEQRNFGFYTSIWDRMFGTYKA
ncbi:Sterol desaturase/sphingolipid hydroxylase, fatty acid hydroxylase superfamily [Chitinophaga ginsengisegetis]|uniref:Sterol desaturase/sphingolipid hydroxylase, fatty acid hydroxylase superfamily n=2 Tax=Chitinophaga ginsengisegetis TaxID=393003 RepID=A0A1T5PBN9_9BACT|nr:Sterol desaturase/sphingolipid hydroxylase, fatty acid hydroxylase superfamily [Chitinophaga ginsengisegetis]